jgi:hypothetical protein
MAEKEDLTKSQRSLLEWLSVEEFNPYGECHGIDLDRLVGLGLAKIEVDELEGSKFWAPVSLTDAGRTALSEEVAG